MPRPRTKRVVNQDPQREAWREKCPLRSWLATPYRGRVKLLTEKLGVSRNAVYKWASGTQLPTTERLIGMCKIIRVSVSTYMDWWKSFPADGE